MRVARNGKAPDGRQKYKCLAGQCGRQFIPGVRRVRGESKAIAARLLLSGVSAAVIHSAMPELSLRAIYRLRRSLMVIDKIETGGINTGNGKGSK